MNRQNDEVIFGISRNTLKVEDGLDTITIKNAVDQTFLMVMKYELGDAAVDNDDTVRLYINPDPLKSEAEQTGIILRGTDSQADRKVGDIVRLRIRQRGQNALIGGIRVGTDWTEVLQGSDVTGVSLDQETLTIDAGASATLVATVMPEDARDPSVSWSSSNDAVATVAAGVVTGVAEGTATITATTTDGSFTATCDVTVNAANAIFGSSAANVSIYPNPSTGTFTISDAQGADVIVFDATGRIVYQKSDIDNNEMVDADLAKGMYVVSVTKDNDQKFAKLIIE